MYKTHWLRVGTGQVPQEKDGLFGHRQVTHANNGYCDINNLSNEIESICNAYEKDGYSVVSILPIIRGKNGIHKESAWGYSVTDGVIITLYKKNL